MCWSKKTYAAKAAKHAELKAAIDELQKELNARDEAIKADMGEREEQEAGAFMITYKTINQMRFDPAAFKAEHKKLYESFKRPKSYRSFSVVPVK